MQKILREQDCNLKALRCVFLLSGCHPNCNTHFISCPQTRPSSLQKVPPPSCMHSLLQIGLSHKAASSHLIAEDPITCISQLKKNIQSLHLRKWAVWTPSECVTREKNTASSNYQASTLRTWSFTYLETREKKEKKRPWRPDWRQKNKSGIFRTAVMGQELILNHAHLLWVHYKKNLCKSMGQKSCPHLIPEAKRNFKLPTATKSWRVSLVFLQAIDLRS